MHNHPQMIEPMIWNAEKDPTRRPIEEHQAFSAIVVITEAGPQPISNSVTEKSLLKMGKRGRHDNRVCKQSTTAMTKYLLERQLI
jgi:hypothetical protein